MLTYLLLNCGDFFACQGILRQKNHKKEGIRNLTIKLNEE